LNEDNSLVMVFSDNNWVKVKENKNILTGLNKYEGQVWISLYNLFLLQGQKYEITDFRKNILLKLKKYMNQKLYDTLPPLINLYRALEEMNISNSTQSTSSNKVLIIEQIPELYMFNYGNKNRLNYEEIAKNILTNYFKNADLKKEMSIISEVYTSDNLDYFMENPNCASCGKEASSRCSQCKAEWYCSKECQILRWKSGHKEFCIKMKEMNKELKETLN
jgi:predicted Zn-ribbon and HTH transcriptional regulator